MDRLGVRGFLGEMQRKGLARRSAARALSAVRSLYRYLQEHHGVANTIARAARMPKLEKRLPSYLDRQQTGTLFEWAESRAGGDEFGPTRDLAILELFYSTGMRLSELCGMNLEDLDLLADQAKVRGKGRKERIVPVGSRAVLALRRYLQLREQVIARQKSDRRAVFVSRSGKRLAARGVQRIVHGMLDEPERGVRLDAQALERLRFDRLTDHVGVQHLPGLAAVVRVRERTLRALAEDERRFVLLGLDLRLRREAPVRTELDPQARGRRARARSRAGSRRVDPTQDGEAARSRAPSP